MRPLWIWIAALLTCVAVATQGRAAARDLPIQGGSAAARSDWIRIWIARASSAKAPGRSVRDCHAALGRTGDPIVSGLTPCPRECGLANAASRHATAKLIGSDSRARFM